MPKPLGTSRASVFFRRSAPTLSRTQLQRALALAFVLGLSSFLVTCGSDSDNEFRDPTPPWSEDSQNQTKELEDELKQEAEKEGDAAQKFERVMKHILRWEGGCSDHPADSGGRTFMGITTGRARQNGWRGDVCKMPRARVLSIYREDYWNVRARKHPWPLDLAVMNTEVNSGGGKAKEFLERMKNQNVEGSVQVKASWYVDQQTAFYRAIVARRPSQKVFLRGWLNRSRYMQDVIQGRVASAKFALFPWPFSESFSTTDPAAPALAGGAKAIFELPVESSAP